MVVDLHLPGKTGHELLAEVKNTPALADIPVVIFTSSLIEEDRETSFALQAADHVLKPMDSDAYFAHVQRIVESCSTSKSLQQNEAARNSKLVDSCKNPLSRMGEG
jgi:CheY-like chemotaxis protein